MWFPVCLSILLLAALPGLVLLVLFLRGMQDDVNEWAKANFIPLAYKPRLEPWLALLLVLAPVGVLLLYFLKLKRRPLQVPSTFLWKKSIEDLHVNALFQWLRQNVVLLLQLLVLLVLIYAALGLQRVGPTARGSRYIILIDNSASMAATDVQPSRLEWAKAEAIKVIDAADDDHLGMVVVFNSTATTLQGYTSDKGELRRAVNSIRQSYRQTSIDDALTLADNLANQYRSTEDAVAQPDDQKEEQRRAMVKPKEGIPTEAFLFTDGGFPAPSEATLKKINPQKDFDKRTLGNLQVHFFQAGVKGAENVDNLGIVNLYVERTDRLKDDARQPRPEQGVNLKVYAEVHNFRPAAARVKVRINVRAQGKLVHSDFQFVNPGACKVTTEQVDEREVRKAAPGVAWATFELRDTDLTANPVVHAVLDGVNDHFALDNEAWVVLSPKRRTRVLLVTAGNPALDAFFDQGPTQELAEVERMAPGELNDDTYRDKAVEKVGYDLVIFDRCAPRDVKLMPQAHTLFIGAPPPPWLPGKLMPNPRLIVSKSSHPLLRQIRTLRDVAIGEAFEFHPVKSLPEEMQEEAKDRPVRLDTVLETTGDRPLLFGLRRGAYKDLVMTFALFNDRGDLLTNWPLRRSFPVFLRNVVVEYGNLSVGGRLLRAGEPFLFRPEPGVVWTGVQPPDGPEKKLQRRGDPDLVFADTEQLGVYELVSADRRRSFAVNLLDAQESDIEPREVFQVGRDTIKAEEERQQPYDLWKWFALGALIVLMLEWYVYNRRVFV
jgi:hypothetical protein